MNIILGFGIIEESARKTIMQELSQADDKSVIEKKYKEQAEVFDKMTRQEAPERYTYFYLYPEKVVFHHINRQHAMSPDGWALLSVEEPLT